MVAFLPPALLIDFNDVLTMEKSLSLSEVRIGSRGVCRLQSSPPIIENEAC
jgi:hypothetical protein